AGGNGGHQARCDLQSRWQRCAAGGGNERHDHIEDRSDQNPETDLHDHHQPDRSGTRSVAETNAMKKRTQSGYSLVEVLIALAITSVVLLTVVTLFYMGRRNVYSGKQMTYAVSVGTRMMEDLSSMSSADLLN